MEGEKEREGKLVKGETSSWRIDECFVVVDRGEVSRNESELDLSLFGTDKLLFFL